MSKLKENKMLFSSCSESLLCDVAYVDTIISKIEIQILRNRGLGSMSKEPL